MEQIQIGILPAPPYIIGGFEHPLDLLLLSRQDRVLLGNDEVPIAPGAPDRKADGRLNLK